MVSVEQVPVNIRMPSDAVRIVALQPFLKLQRVEPFQWQNDSVTQQLEAIRRTLDVAQSGFGEQSANFTLFPEYSVPGKAGADIIEERVISDTWPNESIIIAGLHGLTKIEYESLCANLCLTCSPANAPSSVPDHQWVNCCLIWVKDEVGVVRRWVQPKIRPAWPELNVTSNDMFSGSQLYLFEARYSPSGYPFRFITFICFDWVASLAGKTVCEEMLHELNMQWSPNPMPLHWTFVIQHNPGPNHPSFLNSTFKFLTDANTFPFVDRREAVVVHANTAISAEPSRSGHGAFSACVFSPSVQLDCTGCRPTVCMQPVGPRGSDILERCKDVIFREMGECIHAFEVRVPRFVTPDATGRTIPLPNAKVYPANGTTDIRLCGGPVPAAVKWINDSLDGITHLSGITLVGCPLQPIAETSKTDIVEGMRTLDGRAVVDRMDWASCLRDKNRRQNSDLWSEIEIESLEHMVHSLTSLNMAFDVSVDKTFLHGSFDCKAGVVQVVAIRGETHQDCRAHYDNSVLKVTVDPVIVIARDRHNLVPLKEEFEKYNEPGSEVGLTFLDYQTLVTLCRTATDPSQLRSALDDYIPSNNRII